MKNLKLLFLVSQPRSGSTLLQNLLLNSGVIKTSSESWILLPLLGTIKGGLIEAKYSQHLCERAINDFIIKDLGSREVFNSTTRDYFTTLYKVLADQNTEYILDKTPRYYEIVNEIKEIFPDAKILVLRRNPLDVVVSLYNQLSSNKIFDLRHFYRDILEGPVLINNFLNSNKTNQNVKEVKYENLIRYPEIELKGIYDWLGLPLSKIDLSIKPKHTNGRLGDQKILKTSSLETNRVEKWISLSETAKWKKFFSGYLYYLQDNGVNYIDISLEPEKTTFFKSFKDFCSFEIDSKPEISKKFIVSKIFYHLS